MITAEAEREKYRKIWAIPGYRSNSPGESLVSTFIKQAKWYKGDSLLDAGCGTGRAGLALHRADIRVTLLDLCETSVDPAPREALPFMQACLWDLRTELILPFTWVYCCDVLEHIPTEHVDAVLDNLAKLGVKGVFMQIALWADAWGDKIGETLHLTVQPPAWWMEKITARWPVEYHVMSRDGRLIVLTGEPK